LGFINRFSETGYRVAMDSAVARDGTPLEPAPYGPLPVGSTRQVWARREADEAEAKALASTLRLRILRATLHEPRTNKEIAEALGLNPASVLHHVRTLVDTGFLIEQPTRRGARGSRERPYLASGKSFYVSTGLDRLGDGQDLLLETFLEEIKGLPAGQLDSARLGFRLTAEDRRRVQDRLQAVLDEIATLPSDPEGEPWSLYLGLHPDTSGVPSVHDVDRDH
jgi:DNA-binding transcriptional ArsR family regulator